MGQIHDREEKVKKKTAKRNKKRGRKEKTRDVRGAAITNSASVNDCFPQRADVLALELR